MIECDFVVYREGGWAFARCTREKCRLNKKPAPLPPGVTTLRSICTAFPAQSQATILAPDHGPGTEMEKLFGELALTKKAGCKCPALIAEMNRRGVQGCSNTKPEILGWLTEAYDESSLAEWATAGLLAIANGYPLTLAGLLDLAISRAEKLTA